MIEVERKFILKEETINKLTKGAEFISKKTFTDTYYDTANFSLTTKDMWLRQRGDRFELKVPLNQGESMTNRVLDQYEEYETEEEIRKILNLPEKKTLKEDLEESGYCPIATLTTTRKKYKKGEFIIDFDTIDFGYSIGEIELMIKDKSEIKEASDKIIAFAEENGLIITAVLGKLVEYIRRNDSEHYQALVNAGVI